MKTKDKLAITQHWHKYHIPGMSHIHTLKRDAIFISNANSIKHELAKCLGAIQIKRYGDVFFNKDIIDALDIIEKSVLNCEPFKEDSSFITEAVPNEDKTRRVDLVNLKTNVRYEFETLNNIRKEDCITVYL